MDSTKGEDTMNQYIARMVLVAVAGVAVLGATGCMQVYEQAAKTALEDRSNDDHILDAKIDTGILSALADKDKSLLLDVKTDVWEQRVMLTGTLDDAKMKKDVVQLVQQSDPRIRKIYDEIQLVSKAEQEQRREAAKNKDASQKSSVEQTVNDFWIETKINAQLISTRGVNSVNYRWRSVRNVVYLIGRSRSEDERQSVLRIIRATEGVKEVTPFVEIKPVS
jgi:hyperosmotically inducible periplasmic protein